uniref:Synapse differentiation inducing 1 n=1 Tax=Accipiter nisus TaxID=211598 RepID=A0A8B9NE87_9AVES
MDGLVEQNSVLMHNKIAEAGKRNGLINTRNLVAESRDGLVSVYPTPQYQTHRAGSLSSPSCLENGRNDPVQQLLDPNMLQQTVESHYRPNIILYSENVLRSWGESIGSECCETTFIEDRSPTKDSLEYPDSKFIDLSADDIKIHTLSYDVEEEEDFQELEVRSSTQMSKLSLRDYLLVFLCCRGFLHRDLTSPKTSIFTSCNTSVSPCDQHRGNPTRARLLVDSLFSLY